MIRTTVGFSIIMVIEKTTGTMAYFNIHKNMLKQWQSLAYFLLGESAHEFFLKPHETLETKYSNWSRLGGEGPGLNKSIYYGFVQAIEGEWKDQGSYGIHPDAIPILREALEKYHFELREFQVGIGEKTFFETPKQNVTNSLLADCEALSRHMAFGSVNCPTHFYDADPKDKGQAYTFVQQEVE